MLALLGWCIQIEKFRIGKRCMWICISGRQNDDLGTLCTEIVNSWGGWSAGQRWRQLLSRLSASVQWRCTCAFASPSCLQIHCWAMLVGKAFGHVVLTMQSRVSFYRSIHLVMPRKHNTPLLSISNFGARLFDQIFRFLHCGAREPFFGHSGHIQGQAPLRLFQLYPTSLRCHSSRHVENLQHITCCF